MRARQKCVIPSKSVTAFRKRPELLEINRLSNNSWSSVLLYEVGVGACNTETIASLPRLQLSENNMHAALKKVVPTPATHAILTLLKAGERVFQTLLLTKTVAHVYRGAQAPLHALFWRQNTVRLHNTNSTKRSKLTKTIRRVGPSTSTWRPRTEGSAGQRSRHAPPRRNPLRADTAEGERLSSGTF